ncbi:transmembrane protein, putative [Bodo saltans]|uniref:Transmembrane protein, putative n=1 Tax=Bodo saltans TaxID=75058 RepID=A0A0S4IU54_BODSA|nr:transmembrane protein, putative [Bodo saltans]|eukprot:CUF87687.1 transmembrane protein, putative [Bodo saltans]
MVAVKTWDLTQTQASMVNSICSGTANLTLMYRQLRRVNLTFIGANLTNATISSSRLQSLPFLKACALGIVSLNATNATMINSTFSFRVTLLPGVTPALFISRLAAFLQITPTVFQASNFTSSNITSYSVATSFNLTIVGANPIAVQQVVLSMSTSQLIALGASDITGGSTGTGSSTDNTVVIVVCCVVGGLLIIGGIVYFMKRKPSDGAEQKGYSENTLTYPSPGGHEMNKEAGGFHQHDNGGFASAPQNQYQQQQYQQSSSQQQQQVGYGNDDFL